MAALAPTRNNLFDDCYIWVNAALSHNVVIMTAALVELDLCLVLVLAKAEYLSYVLLFSLNMDFIPFYI